MPTEEINMTEIAYNIAKSDHRVLERYVASKPESATAREILERKRKVVKRLIGMIKNKEQKPNGLD
jgi:hypothetical protein